VGSANTRAFAARLLWNIAAAVCAIWFGAALQKRPTSSCSLLRVVLFNSPSDFTSLKSSV
jgi:hypothetical protein